jgi:hypothetical protein
MARRLSVHEIAVSRASGARKLNIWESFLFFGRKRRRKKEEDKKSVNSELVIMRHVAVKGPNETQVTFLTGVAVLKSVFYDGRSKFL